MVQQENSSLRSTVQQLQEETSQRMRKFEVGNNPCSYIEYVHYMYSQGDQLQIMPCTVGVLMCRRACRNSA